MQLVVGDDPLELEEHARRRLPAHGRCLGARASPCCGTTTAPAAPIVERVQQGDGSIAMDKYLRTHLQVSTGAAIDVEFRDFPLAKQVEIVLPADQRHEAMTTQVRAQPAWQTGGQGDVAPRLHIAAHRRGPARRGPRRRSQRNRPRHQ